MTVHPDYSNHRRFQKTPKLRSKGYNVNGIGCTLICWASLKCHDRRNAITTTLLQTLIACCRVVVSESRPPIFMHSLGTLKAHP